MIEALASGLLQIVDEAAAELRSVSEESAAAKPSPGVWSVKELVGHLIDSAANNHQRFVRAQHLQHLEFPGYEQNLWMRSQDYQSRPWRELVDFWVLYNRHLAHVIRHVPAAALDVCCRIGEGESVTLRFLIEDYLRHLRHHLSQIAERRRDGRVASGARSVTPGDARARWVEPDIAPSPACDSGRTVSLIVELHSTLHISAERFT
jgi:hypothetical protein